MSTFGSICTTFGLVIGLGIIAAGLNSASFFLIIFGALFLWFVFGVAKDSETIREAKELQQTIVNNQQIFIKQSRGLVASLGYSPFIGWLCNIPAGIGNVYIDTDHEIIILISPDLSYTLYAPSQIIDVSLNENGAVLTTSENKNLVGRSIGGAIIGGAAGAIIGGTTSQKINSEQIINNVSITMHFDDIKNHTCEIGYLPSAAPRNSQAYINAMKNAKDLHGLLTVLMHRSRKDDTNG